MICYYLCQHIVGTVIAHMHRLDIDLLGRDMCQGNQVFFNHCGMVLATPEKHSLQVYADIWKESNSCCRCLLAQLAAADLYLCRPLALRHAGTDTEPGLNQVFV